jgi:hypothetical protein
VSRHFFPFLFSSLADSHFSSANTDEGASFGTKNLNTTDDLTAALHTKYPALSASEVDNLLSLYPDDPFLGCPFNTGDTVLASGLQDKRSNAIIGDVDYQGRARRFRRKMAEAGQDVYSYRFDQPPQNATASGGAQHFVVRLSPVSLPRTFADLFFASVGGRLRFLGSERDQDGEHAR